MNSTHTQNIVGTPLAVELTPLGVPAHAIVFMPRWDKTANSTTRRFRGEPSC